MLVLGVANYRTVLAAAEKSYYFVTGQGLTAEMPAQPYRLSVHAVQVSTQTGDSYELRQAIQTESGDIRLVVMYQLSPEELQQLPPYASDAQITSELIQRFGQIDFSLQAAGRSLLIQKNISGTGAPYMNADGARVHAGIIFHLSAACEQPLEQVVLQAGSCAMTAELEPAKSIRLEEVQQQISGKVGCELVQLRSDGRLVAVLPQVQGLSAQNYSLSLGGTRFLARDWPDIVSADALTVPGRDGPIYFYQAAAEPPDEYELYSFRFDEIQLYVFPTRLADIPVTVLDIPAEGQTTLLNQTCSVSGVPVQLVSLKNRGDKVPLTVDRSTPYGQITSLRAFELGHQKTAFDQLSGSISDHSDTAIYDDFLFYAEPRTDRVEISWQKSQLGKALRLCISSVEVAGNIRFQ